MGRSRTEKLRERALRHKEDRRKEDKERHHRIERFRRSLYQQDSPDESSDKAHRHEQPQPGNDRDDLLPIAEGSSECRRQESDGTGGVRRNGRHTDRNESRECHQCSAPGDGIHNACHAPCEREDQSADQIKMR